MTGKPRPGLVLIGGFPRAGTRHFCDVVNAVPGCEILGEMNAPVFHRMIDFVDGVDANHSGRWMERGYAARRLEAILETYRLFSKTNANRPVDWQAAKIVGFKKPFVEVSHEHTKRLFRPEAGSVVQFYCLRGIASNFNSLAGAFGYTTDSYKKRIGQSIDALRKMDADDFFRVHPLSLEGFVAAGDKVSWTRSNIFEPMGLSVPPAEIGAYLENIRNRNRTPSDKRRPGITETERTELFGDSRFVAKVEWLERRFGTDLLDP